MSQYELEYSSAAESEERMFQDVHAILEANGVTGEVRRRALLSISEAFTNAVVHGNGLDCRKKIKVGLTINQNSLCADITDQGKGGLEKVRNKKPAGLLAESGRGIDLIRHYSDGLDFAEDEHGGMIVSIRFERQEKTTIES